MKNYLKTKVDIYLEPLIDSILKQRPIDVQDFIKKWISNEGEQIKNAL
jgi:hypothetical protein